MSKWDVRYRKDDYVFGTEPHQFIASILPYLPKGGRALDLATGEGRNGVFHPNQIKNGTGGPKKPELLATLPELQASLEGLEWLVAEEINIELKEASTHQGMRSVIHLAGRKP